MGQSQVKVYSSQRQESHMQGRRARAQGLVRAGVVPTTPRSLERVRREMTHLSGTGDLAQKETNKIHNTIKNLKPIQTYKNL